jgi:hypothetical protein
MQPMSTDSLLPPRKKDWLKGFPQVGAFVRTPDGDTIQVVHDRATFDEYEVALALIIGVHKYPRRLIQELKTAREKLRDVERVEPGQDQNP